MARRVGGEVENNFTRGLITEATGLNFPRNGCTEINNCVINKQGEITRRLSFEYETNFVQESFSYSIAFNNTVINEYLWTTVSNDGNISFVVLQVGSTLYFYTIDEDSSISDGRKTFTVNLDTYVSEANNQPGDFLCEFSSGRGFLFVVNEKINPIYISYNIILDSITVTEMSDISIRDFEGIEDGMSDSERPNTLEQDHQYNLENQGWAGSAKIGSSSSSNKLSHFNARVGDYPNDFDIWWLYKDASDIFLSNSSDFYRVDVGTSPAPKGNKIINAFTRNRSLADGTVLSNQTDSSGGSRPTSTAFFAGRLFLAGLNASKLNTEIYFSQIIENESNITKCYQRNDPTVEDFSDLLPTDGGIIVIPELESVVKMVPVGTSLLVFSTNGVWSISGSEGIGFTADDYSINKISSIGSLSPLSFVDVEGSPYWWNKQGIWRINFDPLNQSFGIESISISTIQTFFNNIPKENIKFVKGSYNLIDRRINWIYRSNSPSTILDNFYYDKVLVFDLDLQSFYSWTNSSTDNIICGITNTDGSSIFRQINEVVDNSFNNVITSIGDNVIVTEVSTSVPSEVFKYTTVRPNDSFKFSFSESRGTVYQDWFEVDEAVDYSSDFITGYRLDGQAMQKFQNNYITIFSRTEINSSCYVRGSWNFRNSSNSGRWTNSQQGYQAKTFSDYSGKKLKIRGSGESLQLRFSSETGKPFNILGWATYVTTNTTP